MLLRRLGHCLSAMFLLLPAYAGMPLHAAEYETLLQKMKRETQGGQETKAEKSVTPSVPAAVLPSAEPSPAGTIKEPVLSPPSSPASGSALPGEKKHGVSPSEARPLFWPPEGYIETPPEGNDNQNGEGDEGKDKGFKTLRVPVGEADPASGSGNGKARQVAIFKAKEAQVIETVALKDDEIPISGSALPQMPEKADTPHGSGPKAGNPESEALKTDGYILGSGDKLRITVFGEKDLSGDYTVNDAGNISYPLIGEVPLRGLTLVQAKDKIATLLQNGYLNDPSVSIEVGEFRPFYITGEVRSPGSYSFVAGMSVMNAVVVAGGFTFRADQDEVEILRTTAGGTKMLKDMGPEEKVVPGDIILVEERFF